MTSNLLAKLETANECSISGLFQELLNKGIKTTPPLNLGDSEGSDFKRLLHKKDKSIAVVNKQQQYHPDSPDFRPAIYLDTNSTTNTNRAMKLGTTIYSFLFQHEDRYFNNDRDDLSKDIFPVGQQKHH
ncbi:hypothetical protein BDF21DRAFT_407759 [Thamnidium elegans]|uniref:Uncharacterized protein n=1 Tax=Thamnidium elegans TaxID=101142 RepID=A0A8H7ST58_9FUNG|nr:hypothetical protein INT48_006714 [Thamnidium elegans]KAI8094013.1 hypothetical protein BDF21DRAFT_407759 [Thamnidium elegans]